MKLISLDRFQLTKNMAASVFCDDRKAGLSEHSQTIFTTEILIKILAATFCMIDFLCRIPQRPGYEECPRPLLLKEVKYKLNFFRYNSEKKHDFSRLQEAYFSNIAYFQPVGNQVTPYATIHCDYKKFLCAKQPFS